MIGFKTKNQPQREIVVPKDREGTLATMPEPALSQDRVRMRAYELYENRGCQPGQDQQDWIRAEQEVLFGKEK